MKDEDFIRGPVPMTKREVRLVALDRLELADARLLVDVGAGTGSVGIEAARRYPGLKVVAVERHPDALALIRQNCDRFALDRVEIIAGHAPLPLAVRADAIFIGGSGGNLEAIIGWAADLLVPGGRLVINLILQENLGEALRCLDPARFGRVGCIQMQVSALTELGGGHFFKPNNPAFIISCLKENTHDRAL
ncbi:decarboxylating cobalt-precorrin-6B (C(15))-methyltransferase [Acerihabitans arboris]|uniref:Decarboxylating cobalt-precorrin-6B (C(15))-methyltransferase n=1 Tax=Acerihabitans arboris TaxID=2691583 RepID=A0A845SE24_9GAMM|nr:decarboxylating cobalt-precorrin-6B (C(15))-methyltransferase [Acerihabitans arboris]NDL63183.1 decarboxylating cobalt-precorrin-6B (C(15))-methyltransferase [Acerihabitans arboris]